MAAIDVGPGATDRTSSRSTDNYTIIDLSNPANDTGILNSFEIWVYENSTGIKLGTFYGSSTTYTSRDYENIGNVTAGSKQTFTGKNCDVSTGDYLGHLHVTGSIERTTTGGSGIYTYGADAFGGGTVTYTILSGSTVSIYATGYTLSSPTVTTQDASSITTSGCIGNGNITDTGGINATRRGFCYKEGTSGDPTTSDSVVYDDGSFSTGAYTKAIAGLKFGTGYRVRAYAVNSVGTSYGTTVQVTTTVIQIVVGGLFKSVSAISVLVGGVWKTTKPNLLVGGTWK
jgi:hypothetical protein